MKRRFVCLSVIWVVITILAVPVFSQSAAQDPAEEAAAPAEEAAAPAEEAAAPNELSVYGEVQAVNAQASSITIQYYDYDSDEEKTLEAVINKDSRLENVKAVNEIKKGDWVDITCATAPGGNIALDIIVEKEDLFEEESASDDVTD
jgi:hypothetical protein